MSEAALALGPLFETVPVAVEKGCSMKPAAVLDATTPLREIPVFPGPVVSRRARCSNAVRAFRVQGDDLVREGLFDGDYVLIGAVHASRPGALVLAESDGRHVLRRTKTIGARGHGNSILPPPARIIGTFLGVIRRRGFGDVQPPTGTGSPARLTPVHDIGNGAPTKVTMLRGRLGMLESTCAETRNPRLQRALRNEAERVRRQLQNEAHYD
jgi:hypothetical protein